jgi:tetraacyldisaccharide 4'-kinase
LSREGFWHRLAGKLWYAQGDLSPAERLIIPLLVPAEAVYLTWLRLNKAFHKKGQRKPVPSGRKIISVGNLVVGGAGKSTLCLHLAGRIKAQGKKAAVVSHSYGAEDPEKKEVLLFRGREGSVPDWRRAGDEAVMMALADPDLLVAAGPDKRRSLEAAAGSGAEVVILDDAFHRLDMARDLDLLLVDASRGLGNGRCLPRGPLREPPSSLTRADAVVITRSDSRNTEDLHRHILDLDPGARILSARTVPALVELHNGRKKETVDILENRRVTAFCGLGHPGGFLETLAGCVGELAEPVLFRDHHPYSRGDIDRLARHGERLGADLVVTTAKDAVKIDHWPPDAPPLAVLRIDFSLDDPDSWMDDKLKEITGTL